MTSTRSGFVAAMLVGVLAAGCTVAPTPPPTTSPAASGPRPSPSAAATATAIASASATPSSAPTADSPASWTAISMLEHRWNHAATLLPDGRVLVVGGGSFEDGRATAELYEPGTGMWTATGTMVKGHSHGATTLLPDGRVLAVGGFGLEAATAELYGPATGRWTVTGSLSEAHSFLTIKLLPDGRVLGVGGYEMDGDRCCADTSTAELYDPSTGTWTVTGSMAVGRSAHTSTLLPDGRVLVAGGIDSGGSGGRTSAELYDPRSGRWTTTGSMAEGRGAHTATLLRDGTVLVTGGWHALGDRPALTTAELYDPRTGRWAATGSMAEARSNAHCGWHSCGHMATLLPDGRVLVAGGGNNPDGASALATAELYDPATGRWTPTARMVVARVGSVATLLLDGTVLVSGGDFSGGPEDIASAEIYQP